MLLLLANRLMTLFAKLAMDGEGIVELSLADIVKRVCGSSSSWMLIVGVVPFERLRCCCVGGDWGRVC